MHPALRNTPDHASPTSPSSLRTPAHRRSGPGPAAHAQSVIYVDRDASGANDGSSWSDAYTNLQTAIDNATGSDQIWIAEGVYMPGTTEGASFVINGTHDGLKIYGGFANGDAFADRNPTEHRTVLSGDIGDDDANKIGGVTRTTDDIRGGNSNHVVYLDGTVGGGITGATVLDGVTVTGGNADDSSPNDRGGGLYCDGRGDGNTCSPQITNVIFVGNSADSGGGAIFNNGDDGGTSSPTITNAIFTNNSASSGGAISNTTSNNGESSPQITNVTFTRNSAESGGALSNNRRSGGVISPVVTNSILYGNGGDEVAPSDFAALTITNSLVQGGFSGTGVINATPHFVNAADLNGVDNAFGTADDGLHLGALSPAVDAGNNTPFEAGRIAENITTDLAGDARIQDGDGDGTATVNLGAYETPSTLPYADLAVSIDPPAPVASGEDAAFTVTLTNTGPDASVAASVDLSTNAELGTLTPGTPSTGSVSGTTWTVGPLPVGQSATLDVTAPFAGPEPGTLTATAIDGGSVDPQASNDTGTATVFTPPYSAETALALDGDGDELNAGPDIRLDNRSFSIDFWAKRATSGSDHLIVSQGATATNNQSLGIGFLADNRFVFGFYGDDLRTTATFTKHD